ncbi:hypothetical protein GJA_194 [Janthinobacterium agaricidamnosum NBRC 102515 = DSM 9628]|uniref:Uncharacterized protein n=2 Tax=Janthinobacterium agaricidamnosum TaxID=55508 RepID=W0V0P1_9BURK|nr:hypothetical protein GJA_194 [Janthinobacterium agaricidamnosum NBRC 102515 = DSM 9628]
MAKSPNNTENSILRRKVKGGLYWATSVAKKHVHFVLDGLDMEAVVRKSASYDNPTGSNNEQSNTAKTRAYTGAELRWIYRNRNNPDVQSHVHFVKEGKPCPPPWVEYSTKVIKFKQDNTMEEIETKYDVKALWEQYTPQSSFPPPKTDGHSRLK